MTGNLGRGRIATGGQHPGVGAVVEELLHELKANSPRGPSDQNRAGHDSSWLSLRLGALKGLELDQCLAN